MVPAAVVGYSMGGVVSLRLAAERPEAVSALSLIASAGIVSLTRRAAVWLDLVSAVRPGRLVARARDAVARRPNLRAGVFGYWGAEDARALSPEAVAGFLAAQPEHEDVDSASRALRREDPRTYLDRVRCPRSSSGAPGTGSSPSRTGSSTPAACRRRSASCRPPATSSSASTRRSAPRTCSTSSEPRVRRAA